MRQTITTQHNAGCHSYGMLYDQHDNLNATMECKHAKQKQTLQVMKHDIEHKCIVELLALLESFQCPDYSLEKQDTTMGA